MPLAGQFNGIRIKYLCGKIIHKCIGIFLVGNGAILSVLVLLLGILSLRETKNFGKKE